VTLDERLRRVFADVFAIEGDAVTDEGSPGSIEAWDSISHLNLVLALEGEFMIQFEAEEIPELASFRAIRDRLAKERLPE
jgi:acyl carrier protein